MEYMTVGEIANKYKISRQSVHKWIKDGKLKAEKIGEKSIRIRVEEVNKLKKEVK